MSNSNISDEAAHREALQKKAKNQRSEMTLLEPSSATRLHMVRQYPHLDWSEKLKRQAGVT
jgi:hypothetical protein